MKRNAHSGDGCRLLTVATAATGLLLAGCASPGPPRPPSLRLPEIVTSLEADRIGDVVQLHWMTPDKTTDGLPVRGETTAVLCREDSPIAGRKTVCTPVQRFPVMPGAGKVVDHLPSSQLSDPPRLIAYRLELLNAKGHSAGPSAQTYALAGAAPKPIADMRVDDTPGGVQLAWRKDDAPVQVRRTLVADANGAVPKVAAKSSVPGQPSQTKEPVEVALGTGDRDSGGMIDMSVMRLETYSYTAQRIRTVTVAGQKLEMRSLESKPLQHVVHDTFPPPVPAGLVVIPSFGGSASVDLSWEPVEATDLAGYFVYRKMGGTWTKLTTEINPAASYRDTTAVAGVNYSYRVTSADQTGNESAPGAEIKVNPEP